MRILFLTLSILLLNVPMLEAMSPEEEFSVRAKRQRSESFSQKDFKQPLEVSPSSFQAYPKSSPPLSEPPKPSKRKRRDLNDPYAGLSEQERQALLDFYRTSYHVLSQSAYYKALPTLRYDEEEEDSTNGSPVPSSIPAFPNYEDYITLDPNGERTLFYPDLQSCQTACMARAPWSLEEEMLRDRTNHFKAEVDLSSYGASMGSALKVYQINMPRKGSVYIYR